MVGVRSRTLKVDDVDIRASDRSTVHNLTVDDLHTFYVVVGDTPILTHNDNCPVDGLGTYRPVGGHHLHAKAAFRNVDEYSEHAALSISQEAMRRSAVGRLLMQARDEAIKSFEAAVHGQLRSARATRVAAAVGGGVDDLSAAGRAAIDDAFVALLTAVETSDDVVLSARGISVAEVSDGLAGELFGDRGWISEFSEFDSTT